MEISEFTEITPKYGKSLKELLAGAIFGVLPFVEETKVDKIAKVLQKKGFEITPEVKEKIKSILEEKKIPLTTVEREMGRFIGATVPFSASLKALQLLAPASTILPIAGSTVITDIYEKKSRGEPVSVKDIAISAGIGTLLGAPIAIARRLKPAVAEKQIQETISKEKRTLTYADWLKNYKAEELAGDTLKANYVESIGELEKVASKPQIGQIKGKPLEAVSLVLEKHVWRPMIEWLEKPEGGVLRKIYRFFIPMPEEALKYHYRFVAEMAKRFGNVERAQNLIRNLTEEQKIRFYEYLTDKFQIEPPGEFPWWKEIKDLIYQQGLELVELGVLKRNRFDRYAYEYLPRLYMRHLGVSEPDAAIDIQRAGQKLVLRYAKKRAEEPVFPDVITDPAVLVPYSLAEEGRDIAIIKYMNELIDAPEGFVFKKKVIRTKNGAATAEYLKEMHDAGEIVLSDAELAAVEEALRIKPPPGFVQIPNQKRYGPLAGLYVRDFIARDIVPAFTVTDTIHGSKAIQNFMRGLSSFVYAWKITRVPWNLPAFSHNFVSNIIQLNMSGMNFAEIGYYGVRAARDMISNGPYMQLAVKMGIKAVTFTETELRELLQMATMLQQGEGGFWKTMSKIGEIMQKTAIPYNKIDEFWRITRLVYGVERLGLSAEEAWIQAQKWVMDYSLVDPIILKLRKHPITGSPFITYTYKILPLAVEAMIKRPWVMLKYLAAPYILTRAFITMGRITEDEAKEIWSILPEWYRNGATFVIPWKDENGTISIVPYTYFIPWGFYQDAVWNLIAGKPAEAFKEIAFTSPFANVLVAFKTGIDPWTGRNIIPETAITAKEKIAHALTWTANQLILPPFMSSYFAHVYGPLSSPEAARVYRRVYQNPVAAAFGVNIIETDLDQLYELQSKKAKAIAVELQKEKTRIKSMVKNGSITPEHAEKLFDDLDENFRKLKEELRFLKERKTLIEAIYLP